MNMKSNIILDPLTKKIILLLLEALDSNWTVTIEGTEYKAILKGGELEMTALRITPPGGGSGRFAKLGSNVKKGDVLTITTVPYEEETDFRGQKGTQTLIDARKEDGTDLKVKLTKTSQRNLAQELSGLDITKGGTVTDEQLAGWVDQKVVVDEMLSNFGMSLVLRKA